MSTNSYTNTEPIPAFYQDLEGSTVVITGAGRGMGRVFTEELVSRGVNVVAADINLDAVTAATEEINARGSYLPTASAPGRAVPARVDVTLLGDQQQLVTTAVEEFGRLDGWVNNAGLFPQAAIMDISADQMEATQNVNVNGVLYGTQAATAHFSSVGGGSIVNMASVSAFRVRPTRGAYNASKAAVLHLNNVMAVELGGLGVRVNAVAPGYIDTEMTRWVHEQEGALEHALTSVPLHRMGSPLEVFAAVYFFLSETSRYITGACLSVDGGSRHV